ncbi:hypothetical protein CL656_02715 [bacterium]|nr:hypothetical protein [bacterium]|tara:strand:+ start:1492 stop:1911 length:420 start_codon:yes stop_codon:yes gene_type:complete
MYFWNIKKLKQDTKENKLTEKDYFNYFFGTTTIGSIAIFLMTVFPAGLENVIITNELIVLIITILGTYYTYKCNKGEKGKNFLGKFTSISFVCLIKYIAIVTTIEIFVELHVFTNYLPTILYGIYYLYVGKHLKELADY